jgi:hypothetical protein
MGRYDDLVKQNGTLEEFTAAIHNAKDCYSLTPTDVLISIKKYEEMLNEAKLLDSNIISMDELRRRKEKNNKDKIIKKLLDHADKLKW